VRAYPQRFNTCLQRRIRACRSLPDRPRHPALSPSSSSSLWLSAQYIRKDLRRGARAANGPWDVWTLEWTTASPPPRTNVEIVALVASRRPLWPQAPGRFR